MYRIITTDGVELGVTDSVRYIKINSNGVFVTANKSDAMGIAYKNIPYNLIGRTEIENADTVIVSEISIAGILDKYLTYDELAAAYNEGGQDA